MVQAVIDGAGGPDEDLRADRRGAQAEGDQVRGLRQPGQAGRGRKGQEEVARRVSMRAARQPGGRSRHRNSFAAGPGPCWALLAAAAGLSVLAGVLGRRGPDSRPERRVPKPGGPRGAPRAAPRISRRPSPTRSCRAARRRRATPGGETRSPISPRRSRFAQQLDFKVGDGIFRKQWVSAPSSTKSSDGLGPLYNARSCQSCHLKDGRGPSRRRGRWPDGDGTRCCSG